MVEFEYISSRGAHGVHVAGQFDALVGSEREIWIGNDGSGLIREARGPVSFFNDEGRARWEAAGSPQLEHDAAIDLFAAGGLSGIRARQVQLAADETRLRDTLVTRGRPLREVQRLLGETTTEPGFCELVYSIASGLHGVQVIPELADQIGRVGSGLVSAESPRRVELVFASDRSELLGYKFTLADAQEFAPAGTTVSWCVFLARAIVDRLPPEIPPIPKLGNSDRSASGGRAFLIRPGFMVSTGSRSDPRAQLAELRNQGVITEVELQSALTHLGLD